MSYKTTRKILRIGYLLMLAHSSFSNNFKLYRQGEILAKQNMELLQAGNPVQVPGFKTDKPEESQILSLHKQDQGAALQEKVRQKFTLEKTDKNSATHLLVETEQKRVRFKIDPATDPLFKQANAIVEDPGEVLKIAMVNGEENKPIETTHACYESGDPQLHRCVLKRHVRLKDLPQKTITLRVNIASSSHSYRTNYNPYHGPRTSGGFTASYNVLTQASSGPAVIKPEIPFPEGLGKRVKAIRVKENKSTAVFIAPIISVSNSMGVQQISGEHRGDSWAYWNVSWSLPAGTITLEIDYIPLPTEEDVIEIIEDTCAGLEEKTDSGECLYGEETIIQGPALKVLGSEESKLEIKREWWEKSRTYSCAYPSQNNCEEFRQRGCVQTDSICHRKEGDRCVEWKQTFLCTVFPSILRKTSFKGNAPFCLDGHCADQTWEPNKDMADSLAKMSLLKEMKKEMVDFREGRIFKGDDMKCSKHCLNFSDCCSLNNGWGEKFKFTRCSGEENLLAQKRREGKCHMVGTYCAKKVLKQCVMKKTIFCCYASKLARVLHEQGRSQLGIGWGDAENPNCRALTVNEFSRIDFSRINLSEVLADVMSQVKVPNMTRTAQNFQENWKARMPKTSEVVSKTTNYSMSNQIKERAKSLGKETPVGAYSLYAIPPTHTQTEEPKAQVVF